MLLHISITVFHEAALPDTVSTQFHYNSICFPDNQVQVNMVENELELLTQSDKQGRAKLKYDSDRLESLKQQLDSKQKLVEYFSSF